MSTKESKSGEQIGLPESDSVRDLPDQAERAVTVHTKSKPPAKRSGRQIDERMKTPTVAPGQQQPDPTPSPPTKID